MLTKIFQFLGPDRPFTTMRTSFFRHIPKLTTKSQLEKDDYIKKNSNHKRGGSSRELKSKCNLTLSDNYQNHPSKRKDLIAFLKALSDEDFITNPRFSNPFEEAENVNVITTF